MSKHITYGAFFLLLSAGCGQKSLSPYEYKKFVENEANGYVQRTESGPYEIRCQYNPAEYMAVNELRDNRIDRKQFETLRDDFKQMDNYTLSIRSKDPSALAGSQSYFSFHMQDRVKKVCNADTLPCLAYHAEPYNAIKGEQYIHIAFEPCGGNPTVLLDRPAFLAEGVGFSFSKNELSTPEIKLNE